MAATLPRRHTHWLGFTPSPACDQAGDVRRVVGGLGRRHPGAEVEASASAGGFVVLHKLAIPKDKRGAGLGSALMRDLAAEADGRGWTLALTPSTDFGGTSRRRLEGFYRRFGFVANRGRRRDFSTTEAMIRRPRGGGS